MKPLATLLIAGSLMLSACAGPAIAAEEPVDAPAVTEFHGSRIMINVDESVLILLGHFCPHVLRML